MKQFEILTRLQRLLDEEDIEGGPEEHEDLIHDLEEIDDLDDLGPGTGELQEVWKVLKKNDDLSGELEDLMGEGSLEEIGEELGLEGLGIDGESPAGREGPSTTGGVSREPRLDRPIARLLKRLAERRRDRVEGPDRPGRPLHRLVEILQTMGELRDRQAETTGLHRLRRFMFSSRAPGGLSVPAPRDPVVVRRREQLQEFFAAWREALDSAPAQSASPVADTVTFAARTPQEEVPESEGANSVTDSSKSPSRRPA